MEVKTTSKPNYNHAIFITCFLKGAIPHSVIRDVRKRYKLLNDNAHEDTMFFGRKFTLRKRFIQEIDRLLDKRRIGPHYLKEIDNKKILIDSIPSEIEQDFEVQSLKVLSNHFHMLIRFFDEEITANETRSKTEEILASIKSNTATLFNSKLKRIGPVWEEENFNIMISDELMFKNVESYIRENKDWSMEESLPLCYKKIKSPMKKTLFYSEFRPRIVV